MRNLQNLQFNPVVEDVVNILCDKTQNSDRLFFHIMFSYYLSKIASMMRVNVSLPGSEILPVNMYAINLAPSGSGKGRSINIIEEEVIGKFKERFLESTFQQISEVTLANIAIHRSNKNGTDPEAERSKLETEFELAGPMVFSFDSGTSAAVKQMRHKLLLAGCGSMNMEIDEIGSNLLGNMEVLNNFLELFDMGKIKQKLVKHTRDNLRQDEVFGATPSNMLLFGTPTKLLNGSKTEEEFLEMLETGYARRCFFGFSQHKANQKEYTAREIYDILTDKSSTNHLLVLNDRLAQLADPNNFKATMAMTEDVTLELLEYRQHCDRLANRMSDHEEARQAELRHRYFKVTKLAAVYAFVDNAQTVTEDHLYQAVALAEESGEAFLRILRRDRSYAKLAAYICSIGREVTHADLTEDLPFYKGSESQKRDMMTLAIAHGYKTNQIIKKDTVDGIEFLSGSSLPDTNLNECRVAYSADITTHYINQRGHWQNLHTLCTAKNHHWTNHELLENLDSPGTGGYRNEVHCKPGFNLVVIDVDHGTTVDTVKMLLEDYKFFLHTTKRHTDTDPRFRLVMPMSHVLDLDANDYKEFMRNVYSWLPFAVDTATNQRSRKWETYPGTSYYNEGELLDALRFIPKTKKAEEHKSRVSTQSSLTNLERWFVNNADEGNRNNQLIRYAYALVDMQQPLDTVKNNVLALNGKFESPLPESEVLSTVLTSVNNKVMQESK